MADGDNSGKAEAAATMIDPGICSAFSMACIRDGVLGSSATRFQVDDAGALTGTADWVEVGGVSSSSGSTSFSSSVTDT